MFYTLGVLLFSCYVSLSLTSSVIIVEDAKACFRRVLAGKRIIRSLVRKSVACERAEDCQRECSDERRFVCEGFNYRLDPSGRGLGDCELLDLPLSRLDLRRDVRDDSDYDYYERDRNNDAPDCKSHTHFYDRNDRPYHSSNGFDNINQHSRSGYEEGYHFGDSYRFRNREDYKHYHQHDNDFYKYYKQDSNDRANLPAPVAPRTYQDGNKPEYPPAPYDYKSYEPYLPPGYSKHERPFHDSVFWNKYFHDRLKDRYYWGLKHYGSWNNYGGSYGGSNAPDFYYGYNTDLQHGRNNNKDYYDIHNRKFYDVPHRYDGPRYWGRYGEGYGSEFYDQQNSVYDYWGFNGFGSRPNGELLPPARDGIYLPPPNDGHYYHNMLQDECSIRMATGFRLSRSSIRKIVSVTNIYECEQRCYKEHDFPCVSYAFRYTVIPNSGLENCYLTEKNYKELDLYTDLEPNRDFDIYGMHSRNKCEQPTTRIKPSSDCFWRVLSGHRLDSKVVKDSLTVKSIVECEVECLRSNTFTCRTFSFRYGSPIIGGVIDNCQLTDWPYPDLDPRTYLKQEPGFELYERGSYGHGCEPYHFYIWRKPEPSVVGNHEQKCYIGHGTPARLLPQATKKSIRVNTETECIGECTKIREQSLFQCLSLSYRTVTPSHAPNCDLSDIAQRDLLSNVDYVSDPDAWLFALNLHNPQCVNGISNGSAGIGGSDGYHYNQHAKEGVIISWITPAYPLDTWRVFSVNGFPCRKGSLCQENKVAKFWYCEIEGPEKHAWDYCCRPDHQCGYSEGFPYQWCYVGPVRTQWRKCSDHYYPYGHQAPDKQHTGDSYLPTTPSWSFNSIASVQSAGLQPPLLPTLDDYESKPTNNFLDPPKPGGFAGQSRRWPVSYLHTELPPNDTLPDTLSAPKARNVDSKYQAISNLIEVIKSNDLKDVRYQIQNQTDNSQDVLHVQIPLPTNFSDTEKKREGKSIKMIPPELEIVDFLFLNERDAKINLSTTTEAMLNKAHRKPRTYSRGYVSRSNRPRRQGKNLGIIEFVPRPP